MEDLSKISPSMYWGKRFINSANRQYVILAGFTENLENLADSIVYFCDPRGRMLTSGLRWSLFLISYVPSMNNCEAFKKNELS